MKKTQELRVLFDPKVNITPAPLADPKNNLLFMDDTDSLYFIVALDFVQRKFQRDYPYQSISVDGLHDLRLNGPAIEYLINMKDNQTMFNAKILGYLPSASERQNPPLQMFLNYIEGSWNCIEVFHARSGGSFLVFQKQFLDLNPHLNIRPTFTMEGGQ